MSSLFNLGLWLAFLGPGKGWAANNPDDLLRLFHGLGDKAVQTKLPEKCLANALQYSTGDARNSEKPLEYFHWNSVNSRNACARRCYNTRLCFSAVYLAAVDETSAPICFLASNKLKCSDEGSGDNPDSYASLLACIECSDDPLTTPAPNGDSKNQQQNGPLTPVAPMKDSTNDTTTDEIMSANNMTTDGIMSANNMTTDGIMSVNDTNPDDRSMNTTSSGQSDIPDLNMTMSASDNITMMPGNSIDSLNTTTDSLPDTLNVTEKPERKQNCTKVEFLTLPAAGSDHLSLLKSLLDEGKETTIQLEEVSDIEECAHRCYNSDHCESAAYAPSSNQYVSPFCFLSNNQVPCDPTLQPSMNTVPPVKPVILVCLQCGDAEVLPEVATDAPTNLQDINSTPAENGTQIEIGMNELPDNMTMLSSSMENTTGVDTTPTLKVTNAPNSGIKMRPPCLFGVDFRVIQPIPNRKLTIFKTMADVSLEECSNECYKDTRCNIAKYNFYSSKESCQLARQAVRCLVGLSRDIRDVSKPLLLVCIQCRALSIGQVNSLPGSNGYSKPDTYLPDSTLSPVASSRPHQTLVMVPPTGLPTSYQTGVTAPVGVSPTTAVAPNTYTPTKLNPTGASPSIPPPGQSTTPGFQYPASPPPILTYAPGQPVSINTESSAIETTTRAPYSVLATTRPIPSTARQTRPTYTQWTTNPYMTPVPPTPHRPATLATTWPTRAPYTNPTNPVWATPAPYSSSPATSPPTLPTPAPYTTVGTTWARPAWTTPSWGRPATQATWQPYSSRDPAHWTSPPRLTYTPPRTTANYWTPYPPQRTEGPFYPVYPVNPGRKQPKSLPDQSEKELNRIISEDFYAKTFEDEARLCANTCYYETLCKSAVYLYNRVGHKPNCLLSEQHIFCDEALPLSVQKISPLETVLVLRAKCDKLALDSVVWSSQPKNKMVIYVDEYSPELDNII